MGSWLAFVLRLNGVKSAIDNPFCNRLSCPVDIRLFINFVEHHIAIFGVRNNCHVSLRGGGVTWILDSLVSSFVWTPTLDNASVGSSFALKTISAFLLRIRSDVVCGP